MHGFRRWVPFVIMAMVWFSAPACGSEKPDPSRIYTLDALYRSALKNGEEIQIFKNEVQVAQKTKDMALSVLFPRFTGIGSARRYSKKVMSGDSLVQPDWSAHWGARLDQSFTVNGKELIAFDMAKDNIVKAEHDLNAAKEAYLFSLAQTYYGVARGEKGVEIAKANVRRLQTHKDSVLTQLRLEAVTRTALLRAEAELSNARAEQIRAENNYRITLEALSRIAGVGPISAISIGDVAVGAEIPEDLEGLKNQATENRAEIKAAHMDHQIAEKQVDYTKSAYWPTASLESAYLNYEQGPSEHMALKDSFWVGGTISIPIYDAGLRKAQIAEAKARSRQAMYRLRSLEKQVTLEMDTAFRECATQKGVLSALEDQWRFAKENYIAVTRQFDNGLANSVDVMDANTLLVTAQQEMADAVFGLQLALLRIDRARGTFLADIETRLAPKHSNGTETQNNG